MNTAPGAEVAPHDPQAISGNVLAPPASPDSHTKHRFVHLLHDMVDHSAAFKEESVRLEAHRVLDAFRAAIIPGEHLNKVVKETDRAPIEDVRLRVPPMTGVPAPVAGIPVIDYALLAQYIVQAQQAQARAIPANPPAQLAPEATPNGEGVHVITDAPASE